MKLKHFVELLDICKESLLKYFQYLSIFVAWFMERNKNQQKFERYFKIYLKIFHSRKLFRLLKTLHFVPLILQNKQQLKVKVSFMNVFILLSRIFTGLFYAMDNLTIIAMKMNFDYYKIVRRISYATLFAGILFSTIANFIELRQNFNQQANLKKQLESMTPTDLLQQLAQIDQRRKIIAIKLIKAFGHLFPTLARTNLPQIIVKTKINKGTVGFFGMISAASDLYLKFRDFELKNQDIYDV